MSPSTSASSPAVDPQNPWLGLASFTEETRSFFRGRDDEVGELGRRVQRKLLTILFGQSGLGKTSILRAGIVPRLRPEGYCPVYVRLDYGRESPPPSDQIKQAIFRATEAAGHWTQPGAAAAGESLWEFLHHRDDTLKDRTGRTLIPLLIFDQFEEIFTLAQGDDFGRQRAAQFIEDLADLVENRAPRALEARLEADEAGMEKFDFARADYRILIALREDYLAHLEGLKAKMPSVTQNRMRLARMTGAQALMAVTGPGGALVNDEVAGAIVRFVAGGSELERAEVEPSLLSLVCRELNNTRVAQGQAIISVSLLAGSRDTILNEFYDRTLADQPAGVRAFIEDELLTDSGYRESIAEERVKKGFAAAGAGPESLAALVDRRLLRVEERLDVRRVELTHDVLCGVVKASRDLRHERESKAGIERQLAETQAREVATRRALFRARMVAVVCALLAVGAIGSAVFGYANLTRARASERAALSAQTAAKYAEALTQQARVQAEDVLSFMLVDLAERLGEVGQPLIMDHVSEKALKYYESLPEALHTADTVAGYGMALTQRAWIFTSRNEIKPAQELVDKALALFERAERQGPLAPEARLAYANALGAQAGLMTSQRRFDDVVKLAERAEKMAETVVADPRLGGRAQRTRARAISGKAFGMDRGETRRRESIAEFERGIAVSQLADQMEPKPRYPGLQSAWMRATLSQALRSLNENARAREVTRQMQQTLETLQASAPELFVVKEALGRVANELNRLAWPDWDEAEGAAVQARGLLALQESLVRDPRNWSLRNSLAIANFSEESFRVNNGDWARLEQLIRETEPRYDSANETGFMRANHAGFLHRAAQSFASTGRDREAATYLAAAQKEDTRILAEIGSDAVEHALREAAMENTRRLTAQARLDYAAVRADAFKTVQKLNALQVGPQYAERIRVARSTARLHEGRAAFALGDYVAAMAAFTQWRAERTPRPPIEQQSRQERASNAGNELQWALGLVRVGRLAEARAALAPALAEAEALLSDRPQVFIAQKLMARALATRAEVETDLPAAERRALLERARGLLRDNGNDQRLTRYEREVVLRGIETDLAK